MAQAGVALCHAASRAPQNGPKAHLRKSSLFFDAWNFAKEPARSPAWGGILYNGGISDEAEAESAFLTFFYEAGGPGMLAFAAIVIIAAEMSSVDSQLTLLGVVVGKNVIEKMRGRAYLDHTLVNISRWSIIIWSVIAIFLSMGDLPFLITIAMKTYEMPIP